MGHRAGPFTSNRCGSGGALVSWLARVERSLHWRLWAQVAGCAAIAVAAPAALGQNSGPSDRVPARVQRPGITVGNMPAVSRRPGGDANRISPREAHVSSREEQCRQWRRLAAQDPTIDLEAANPCGERRLVRRGRVVEGGRVREAGNAEGGWTSADPTPRVGPVPPPDQAAALDPSARGFANSATNPADGEANSSEPETVDSLLVQERTKDAMDLLREQLATEGEDALSLRRLALLEARLGQWREASASALRALALDPILASRPLEPADGGLTETQLRSLANESIRRANRAGNAASGGSAGAWVLATMLAQAEGRHDVAHRLAGRAASAGLETVLADALLAGTRPDSR